MDIRYIQMRRITQMKKLLTTLAAVALLAGCSNGGDATTTETPAASETPVETTPATEAPVETVSPTADAQAEVATLDLSAVEDGTYEGSATGMAEIKVSLTVEGGKITAAEVVGEGETEGLGLPVVEAAADEIVANQGHIEVVSGATITSDAVNAAIDAALAK